MEWKGELVKFLKGSIVRGYLLLASCLLFFAFFFFSKLDARFSENRWSMNRMFNINIVKFTENAFLNASVVFDRIYEMHRVHVNQFINHTIRRASIRRYTKGIAIYGSLGRNEIYVAFDARARSKIFYKWRLISRIRRVRNWLHPSEKNSLNSIDSSIVQAPWSVAIFKDHRPE